mmetsp:Transcript_49294/g.86794  ORF Transcript_49294/g.86794 Transcript_49294/m.86794 type:complete len:200 (-) Transcript_49294:90-689(-)
MSQSARKSVQSTPRVNDVAEGLKNGANEMSKVTARMKQAEYMGERMRMNKEEAFQQLVFLKQKLEMKEKEIAQTDKHFQEVKRNLDEKRRRRDDLRKLVEEQMHGPQGLQALLKKTKETTRTASYWVKEHSGNYHVKELAVQRGYACSTLPPRQMSLSQPGSARRPFAKGSLSETTAAPPAAGDDSAPAPDGDPAAAPS